MSLHKVNKKFDIKAKLEQVVLEVLVFYKFDMVDESNRVDKYKKIALS